jgi:hypothetical protein
LQNRGPSDRRPVAGFSLMAQGLRSPTWQATARTLLLAAVLVYTAATALRVVARKHYVFLPGYVRWAVTPVPQVTGPTHLLVLFTDHFEPNRQVSVAADWMKRYAAMAARHRDAAGRSPQHTWFYPAEQHEPTILEILRGGVRNGLGEVEFHFHHDFDTSTSLRPRLEQGLEQFAAYGFNRTVTNETRFAFIHGNFGLDNSTGAYFCGVNDELRLLSQLGAFADFTFPSVYLESQPPVVNRLYAARDDERPRSYDTPLPLDALARREADLMIFEGPLVFAPTWRLRRLFLELDDGSIHPGMPADPARIRAWLRARVHVPSRPEWVFIKLFAHGASSQGDMEAVTGTAFDGLLDGLESRYNDGRRFVLHYVTARQAYNIAMAAVDGHGGDPEAFLDYRIPRYLSNARLSSEPLSASRR